MHKDQTRPDIPPGSHVRVSRTGYWHHGIAVEGGVIHLAGKQRGEGVTEGTWMAFADGDEVYVVEEPESFPPVEVVRRARSHLGQGNYNVLFNNCEQFASWCSTGRHESRQVALLVAMIVGSATANACRKAGSPVVDTILLSVGAGAVTYLCAVPLQHLCNVYDEVLAGRAA